MSPSLPYAADVESPLKPDELQVLRAQYEKEGEYVGLQTKFNYAWGLIKSLSRNDQQEGVRLLSEIFRNSRERRRECLYYLALGNYKLGNYAEARRYNELLLELEPANLQADSLKGLINDKVAKEGLLSDQKHRVAASKIPPSFTHAHSSLPYTRIFPSYLPPPPLHLLPNTSAIMERSTDQSQPSGTPTPGRRDMMFCHECHDEWYRDEHGLTCPECHSDFTEIIEDDNDPRDAEHEQDEDEEDDDSSIPDFVTASHPHQPLHGHPLWRHMHNDDDPDEGDISNLQWRQVGPGRFSVSMNRTITPNAGPGGAAAALGNFATLLNSVIGGAVGGLAQQANPGNQDNQDNQNNQNNEENQEARARGTPGASTGSGTLPGGHRFTYSSTARLIPRDTDRPGNVQPVDELNNVLIGLMAAFGETPGQHHHHHEFGGGGGDDPHNHPINPFMGLFTSMVRGNGQAGDFVYSQEGLDRIVSQLMEQTATSTAPGPAPQSEIENLLRKQVTMDMLGPEGRAECSICMDEVNIGEEVSELPCRHWFHHACVAAWLAEHDTCPHCRKGISKHSSSDDAQASGGATGADASRQMPGAFGGTGEGTFADPYVIESPSSNSQGRTDSQAGPGSADESGGFGDRIRRGLFGPPSG
ncbi:hypothetical protein K504DRAFT_472560 [Pleomassaria siparia CBS 279.74]|uniref:Mitochondrial fission 1 protein n=1 Tax=Pleomassaria siparia CBS 279.74 TaxID=1314801 RepID=A0A6G1KKM1_9PLEO|nr:hypothetical protein K504DRAFT_472560 [Pleomassaria siparia CBS 279.74]